MSIMQIEDNLILDSGSQALKNQFDRYCDWCWGHGYGNCDICRKIFRRYYTPIRIAEKQIELGLPPTRAQALAEKGV
jgi:hypothetical protein|nr:MAG TPA: UDP zinc-binding RING-finger protein [Caudoviricetes sp.]